MSELQKIRTRIAEIAQRPKNVTLSDIEWVVNQPGKHGYDTVSRQGTHGRLFRVSSQRFMVSGHNPGSKQVKQYAVWDFINAMTELGLYEE